MQKESLLHTQQRIRPYIHNTPILSSRLINKLVGASVYFKCENFQRMGAFKMRGATNAILQLNDAQKSKGVLTHSSGNFAQALSLAAKNLNVKATIVMPKNAPQVKKDAVLEYGGIIVECESTPEAREAMATQIETQTGATFIHPSNDLNVIYGNATAAMELLESHNDLNTLFAPVGGGGLLAGTALASHFFTQNCEVIGAEPFEVDDAFRSLQSGKIEMNTTTNTIADGLRTNLGNYNFPIIQKHVSKIICVSESDIIVAMKLIWERMKIVIEPSSAVAFAALLKENKQFQNQKIGIILSGGNVDLKALPFS